MFSAFAKLPLYGKKLEIDTVPESVVHNIEFNDLPLILANDFVWAVIGKQFVCCQVRSKKRRALRETAHLISYEIEYGHPEGSAKRTIQMGQEVDLFYIDLFFIYRHFTLPKGTTSANIIRLGHKKGGS